MKASDFRKQGKLGCAECFQAFEKDVKAIVSQMAARPHHAGRLPRSFAEQAGAGAAGDTLREELREAVEREDYEEAARLRDRLREMDTSV
jgi:protein arginine kinase activator